MLGRYQNTDRIFLIPAIRWTVADLFGGYPIPKNIGSEKTILANGGVYESTVHEPNSDRDLKRFWIEIK